MRVSCLIAAGSVALLAVACHSPVTVPGPAAAAFAIAPRDTAILAGDDFRIRVTAVDSAGNSVRLTPIISADGPANVSGTRVTGTNPGRVKLIAVSGSLRDSAFVSVVPDAMVLAARADGIYLFRSDGSDKRRVITAQGARSPRWLPGSSSFVFSIGLQHAYKSDLDGKVTPLLQNPEIFSAELWAHPTRDGQWVYFGGYDLADFRGQPYRVRADGSQLTLAPGFTSDNFTQGHPSASPDGKLLAYFREEFSSRNVLIRVLDMENETLLVAGVPGHGPEWSHGDSIGYVDMQGGVSGPIRLMSSRGNGRRQVGSGTAYDFGFDWSPDDKWIIANDLTSGRLEIIEVRTGVRLPLSYSTGFFNPSWK